MRPLRDRKPGLSPAISVLAVALVLPSTALAAHDEALPQRSVAQRSSAVEGDAAAVMRSREALGAVITFMDERPELFPKQQPDVATLPPRAQREAAWAAWKRFLDHVVALDVVGQRHARWWRLRGDESARSFAVARAAHAAKYRHALEFIERVERSPALPKILNDEVAELGLPAGTYDRIKLGFLNLIEAGEFAAWEAAAVVVSDGGDAALMAAADEDTRRIWEFAKWRGESLTAANAVNVVRSTGSRAWFPVQAGAAQWMGDTRVVREEYALVSLAQVRRLERALEPGDILLSRREWFLSNVGLPGFWPHAALHVGTPSERRAYFASEDVRAWVREQGEPSGDLEALLAARTPGAAASAGGTYHDGRPVRVLEAISEGVSFTSLEHAAHCDSLAVLRPRLVKREKAEALVRAFSYAGRPYDFDFDFRTDSAIVCTELVCKAYETERGTRLAFPLVDVMGRMVTPANEMVRQFDVDLGTPRQQLDLVLFLDGDVREKRAHAATEEAFRASWKRPKWHLVQAYVGARP